MQPLSTPSRTAPTLSRRQWLTTTLTLLGAGTAAALAPSLARAAGPAPTPVEVWKDPQLRLLQGLGGPHAGQWLQGDRARNRQQRRARHAWACRKSWARATPPWWAATWWKAMCPPAMCAPCCSKNPRPWASLCLACPWARPAWTAPCMATAATPTTCCWWRTMAAPAFSRATTKRHPT